MKLNPMAFANPTRNLQSRTFPVLKTAMLTLCGVAWLGSQANAAEKDTLNSDDVKFVKAAAATNMGEAMLGELGVSKASSSGVKTFAEMIVKHHATVSDDLMKLASTKGVDVSTGIDPEQAEKIQDLEKLSGPDFDKHFVAEVVSDYKNDVSDFEKASTNSKDADLRSWVDKMIPTVKAHLVAAQQLDSDATVAPKAADNTARNMRDRNEASTTPLDQGSSKSDTEITAQIRREIVADKNLSTNAHNVKIITTNGKVTLRGPVNTTGEQRVIRQIAEKTVPSINVDSQLEVK